MKLVPRGGVWQVHFDGPDGSRQRKSTNVKVNPALPDRGKAEAGYVGADKVRAVFEAATPEAVRRKRGQTLAGMIDRSWQDRWSKQRSAAHKKYVIDRVKRDVGYWVASEVTYSRLLDYTAELERAGDRPATRNRKLSVIHTALSDAHKRQELPAVPDFPYFAEDNLKERYLTFEEEAVLLQTMRDHLTPVDLDGAYMVHVVELLLDTGLRAGEVIFDATQVHRGGPEGGVLHLRHGTTKSGKARAVPLTARAEAAAVAMLASPVHAKLRAVAARDKEAASDWLGRRFATACRRAGIEGVTLHTLRHTCASRLALRGVDIRKIQLWLGHASVVTTERYAHLIPGALDVGRKALEGGHTAAPAQPLQGWNLYPPAMAQPKVAVSVLYQGVEVAMKGVQGETRSHGRGSKTGT